MSKVCVIGDLVIDSYLFGSATRLCPEGPVPVIVPDETESVRTSRGGAGLVTDQLRALIGKENIIAHFGSKSRKERIFADGRLICRVDYDSIYVSDKFAYERAITRTLRSGEVNMLIVSDYGKGAMTMPMAERIMQVAKIVEIPVLVDAKNSWHFYPGAFAVFPNQRERLIFPAKANPQHIIQKLGEQGCKVDGIDVHPQSGHAVRDTTGAGDIFLAAFAYAYREYHFRFGFTDSTDTLQWCAGIANEYAGRSVGHIGTKIISKIGVLA